MDTVERTLIPRDTALAFARRGASVHAVEPSSTFCRFIRKNLKTNCQILRTWSLLTTGVMRSKAGQRPNTPPGLADANASGQSPERCARAPDESERFADRAAKWMHLG